MNDKVKDFRDGIFALRTRRFGTIAEIMIQKLCGFSNSNTLEYDKFDRNTNKRIEVKFSTVMKKSEDRITPLNVIEQTINATTEKRAIKQSEINKYNFDCNIQQIKTSEFDILYYGLFFADEILIFKMNNLQVKECPGYSDKQHRGNKGEGQFHIKNDNIEYHMQNLCKKISYEELYALFKQP